MGRSLHSHFIPRYLNVLAGAKPLVAGAGVSRAEPSRGLSWTDVMNLTRIPLLPCLR